MNKTRVCIWNRFIMLLPKYISIFSPKSCRSLCYGVSDMVWLHVVSHSIALIERNKFKQNQFSIPGDWLRAQKSLSAHSVSVIRYTIRITNSIKSAGTNNKIHQNNRIICWWDEIIRNGGCVWNWLVRLYFVILSEKYI